MTRAKALVLGIGGLALVLAVGAALAGTSVTITSPATGSTVSRHTTPTMTVTGAVKFAPVNATTTKLYLRRDGCGTSNDNPHLSVTAGAPDGGDGCGFIGGNGVASEAAPGLFSTDYPTSDGMPVLLDTTRQIQGTLDLENDAAGVGQVTLDFQLEALVAGQGIVVGSDTETVFVDPTTSDYPVAFHIAPSKSLEQARISALDLHVFMHGAYSDSGYTGLSGKSFMTVPGYSASPTRSVVLSLDDAKFTHPFTATLNSAMTSYTAPLSTPAVGSHVLYARAIQGGARVAATSSNFTVTS
jgi:hypothetical protein